MSDQTSASKAGDARPKIVFVNRFYAPDTSATSQILTDIAEALARQGHSVIIKTSGMSYDGQSKYPRREVLNGVLVERIWTTRFGRGTTPGRVSDYLTFYLSISLSLLFRLAPGSILVAKTDPPMLSVPLGLVARIKRAKLVNWLQDVFPEVAMELGVASADNMLVRAIKHLRNRSLGRAASNIAIGTRMAERLAKMGVPEPRIHIIENFVDDHAIRPSAQFAPDLRKEWGLTDDDFVVGYSGNLGRAHDLDTVLNSATALAGTKHIKFLFIGGGFLRATLTREIESRGLTNVILQPYQPRERLPESLALPNLHWASLKPSLEGLIVPSKAYGIAAAGRPMLMVGDPDGELGRILEQHDFGICLAPGAHKTVERFILDLSEAPEEAARLGENARRFIDNFASMDRAFERWHALVQRVQTGP